MLLNVVQLYPHPDDVLACSKTVIRNRSKANTRKNLSLVRAKEKKTIALIEAAKNSFSAISKDNIRCDQALDHAKLTVELKEKREQLV